MVLCWGCADLPQAYRFCSGHFGQTGGSQRFGLFAVDELCAYSMRVCQFGLDVTERSRPTSTVHPTERSRLVDRCKQPTSGAIWPRHHWFFGELGLGALTRLRSWSQTLITPPARNTTMMAIQQQHKPPVLQLDGC